MKIVQINSVSNGSTGSIMMNIHKALLEDGHESYVVWGRGRKSNNQNEIYMNDKLGVYFHALYSRLTGKTGFASKRATKKLLKKLDEIKPDIIHLHNIHGYYINIELLFNYIKKNNIRVIWTLHDCWAFTGQCPHFTMVKCDKWKKECYNCPMIHEYPKTIKDNSKWNYKKKKELFNGLNMQLVTPSKWLAELVKQSFLKEYSVDVINNGIDTNVFKPTKSNFREKYGLEDKKIILGVAGVWDKRKGLGDFLKLSNILDNNYIIVLVGLNKKQIKRLPKNIIGITRTENQQELAGLYTTSDVFLNLSKEESFGLTTIEAKSCNTKILVTNSTALPEIVKYDKRNLLNTNESKIVYDKIREIINLKVYEDNIKFICINNMNQRYLELYKKYNSNDYLKGD